MELGEDLSADALAAALGERPARAYPAMLSTEAEALAWARAGAPDGAVVVADFQAAPRGRGGWRWEVMPGAGLGFSLILRPGLAAEREGWLYTAVSCGVADALGDGVAITWPDELHEDGRRVAAVAIQADTRGDRLAWAVASVLVADAAPPRAPLLGKVVEAVEARVRAPAGRVLADYGPRCQTIGRDVRARLVPLGPRGPEVSGTAVRALADGALLLATADRRRVAVRPQALGILEDLG